MATLLPRNCPVNLRSRCMLEMFSNLTDNLHNNLTYSSYGKFIREFTDDL